MLITQMAERQERQCGLLCGSFCPSLFYLTWYIQHKISYVRHMIHKLMFTVPESQRQSCMNCVPIPVSKNFDSFILLIDPCFSWISLRPVILDLGVTCLGGGQLNFICSCNTLPKPTVWYTMSYPSSYILWECKKSGVECRASQVA